MAAHLLRDARTHASFIRPRAIRELRDLTRRRKRMLGAATSEKNRVQKILEDANVKLGWRRCCEARPSPSK